MTWTPERRAAQSARIRAHRPWAKSTGPRAADGKARSSRNAYKHGFRSDAVKTLRALLRLQRAYVRAVRDAARAGGRLGPADNARLFHRPAAALYAAHNNRRATPHGRKNDERTIGGAPKPSLFSCAPIYKSGITIPEHIRNTDRPPPDADQNLYPRRA